MLVPSPDDGSLVNVTHLIPRSKEDLERRRRAFEITAGGDGRDDGPHARLPQRDLRVLRRARRRVGPARQRAARGEPRRLPEGDARPRSLDDTHDHQPAGRPLEAGGRAGRRRGRAAQGRRDERGDRRTRRPDARDARAVRRRADRLSGLGHPAPGRRTTRSPSRSRWRRPVSSSSAATRSRRAAATSTIRSRRASTRWTQSRSSTTSSCPWDRVFLCGRPDRLLRGHHRHGLARPHHAPGVHARLHEAPVRVRPRPPDRQHDRRRALRPHPGEARADLEHGRADAVGDRRRRGRLRRSTTAGSGIRTTGPFLCPARRDAEVDAARERAAAADRRRRLHVHALGGRRRRARSPT